MIIPAISTVFHLTRETSVRCREWLIVWIKIFLSQKNGMNFWWIIKNKLQIVNLLVDYIKLGRILDKPVIVNQGSKCFLENGNDNVWFPELDSSHMEADQKNPMHAVCVVGNNLSLNNISYHIYSHLYFWQGKTQDNDGAKYDIHAIVVQYVQYELKVFAPQIPIICKCRMICLSIFYWLSNRIVLWIQSFNCLTSRKLQRDNMTPLDPQISQQNWSIIVMFVYRLM